VFGRATIRLGIGPHSSFTISLLHRRSGNKLRMWKVGNCFGRLRYRNSAAVIVVVVAALTVFGDKETSAKTSLQRILTASIILSRLFAEHC